MQRYSGISITVDWSTNLNIDEKEAEILERNISVNCSVYNINLVCYRIPAVILLPLLSH